MIVQGLAFYVFAAITVASGVMVIASRNPVHSVLFLILAFFNSAALFLLLGAEFLAMILVVVYVGAVAVLFLFVVMMLDINFDAMRQGFRRHLPLAGVIGGVVTFQMAAVLLGGFRMTEPKAMAVLPLAGEASNTRDLGVLLYSEYVLPVQIAAVILLVAIVAAIALTLRARKDTKHISVDAQVRVRSRDRMRVVQMAATQAAPEPSADPAGPAAAAAPAGEKKA